jgi:hypothetical protein
MEFHSFPNSVSSRYRPRNSCIPFLKSRLEKRERICTLNILASSMYLTKFLIFSVRLLIFDVIGMALVALCGQAYLRQMSINLKIYSHLNTLQLIALTSTSQRFDGGTSWDMYTAIVNSLFISALMGSVTTESFSRHVWVSPEFPLINESTDSGRKRSIRRVG